jgi:hypothetical protein
VFGQLHMPGVVRAIRPGHLRVFFDPLPGYDGFVGDFVNEGTFARARARAARIKQHGDEFHGVATSAGLALGNVTYYFTDWASTPDRVVVTRCLADTYAGQPRWPADLDPVNLIGWTPALQGR